MTQAHSINSVSRPGDPVVGFSAVRFSAFALLPVAPMGSGNVTSPMKDSPSPCVLQLFSVENKFSLRLPEQWTGGLDFS